jgi:DNA modification methylase
MDGVRLLEGDALAILPTLAAGSVDAVITDPPYGLEFMGKEWDRGVPGVPFWTATLRVLKPGGYLLAMGGSRTYHRLACAIEDAGFQIRDCLLWLYGTGFPKGQGCLKPAYEPIILARKPGPRVLPLGIDECRVPAGQDYFDLDVTQGAEDRIYGSGKGLRAKPTKFAPGGRDQWEEQRNRVFLSAAIAALNEALTARGGFPNTADGRVGSTTSAKEGANPAATCKAGTGCSDGTRAASSATSSSIGGFGRMPTAQSQTDIASIIETASRQTIDWKTWNSCCSATTQSITTESITLALRSLKLAESRLASTGSGSTGGRYPSNVLHDGSEEVLEAFAAFGEKTSGKQAAGGHVRNSDKHRNTYAPFIGQRCEGDVLYGDTGSAARFFYCAKASKAERGEGNGHPTVKPLALMRWLVRLACPAGGTVLDPFAGSGTTLLACQEEGRAAIGIEREPQYCQIIKKRLAAHEPLFAQTGPQQMQG